MQITNALLQGQGDRPSAESNVGSASTIPFSETDGGAGSCDESEASVDKVHADTIHGYEHMLTEDGEPMLNPG